MQKPKIIHENVGDARRRGQAVTANGSALRSLERAPDGPVNRRERRALAKTSRRLKP